MSNSASPASKSSPQKWNWHKDIFRETKAGEICLSQICEKCYKLSRQITLSRFVFTCSTNGKWLNFLEIKLSKCESQRCVTSQRRRLRRWSWEPGRDEQGSNLRSRSPQERQLEPNTLQHDTVQEQMTQTPPSQRSFSYPHWGTAWAWGFPVDGDKQHPRLRDCHWGLCMSHLNNHSLVSSPGEAKTPISRRDSKWGWVSACECARLSHWCLSFMAILVSGRWQTGYAPPHQW